MKTTKQTKKEVGNDRKTIESEKNQASTIHQTTPQTGTGFPMKLHV